MEKQSTCCVSNWLNNIACPLHFTQHESKNIPEVLVESPELTASYYKEYLGFRIIKKQNRENKSFYLLENRLNFIWLAPFKKKHEQINKPQQIIVNTHNIESEYNYLKGKTKLVKPLTLGVKGERTFAIKDCNGIDIVYQQTFN